MDEEFDNDGGVYAESEREDLVDNDEISPEEEGFMKGYEEADSDDEYLDDESEE